ncbi:hypothetical protein [Streptomyces sp. NPDC048496]
MTRATDRPCMLIATAQGFMAQPTMFGDAAPEGLEGGLRGLVSMDPQKSS